MRRFLHFLAALVLFVGVTATTYAVQTGGAGHANQDSFINGVQLSGTTSGSLLLRVPAEVSTYTAVLPSAVGGAGTVLTDAAGDGNLSWAEAGGSGAFATASNITSNSAGTLGTDDFVFGSDSLVDDADATHDMRFFFDKSKAAFHAGEWSGILGDATGNHSAIFGKNVDNNGKQGTVSGGIDHDINADYTAVFGDGNSVDVGGQKSIVGGWDNDMRGGFNIVVGRTNLTGGGNYLGVFGRDHNFASSEDGNLVSGYNVSPSNSYGRQFSSGKISAVGDSQFEEYHCKGTTADATVTNLACSFGGDHLDILDNSAWVIDGLISARASGGAGCTDGDVWGYQVTGVIERTGATTTMKAETTVDLFEADVAFDAQLDADDADDGLELVVTGVANCTVGWTGIVRFSSITY